MAVLYLKYVDGKLPVPIHAVLCVLAYLVWSLLAVVAMPFMTVFRLFKVIEKALIGYQNLGTVFSNLDLPFLHETENNRNFIIGMLEIDGEPNIDRLRKCVLSRLVNQSSLDVSYKRLLQRITRYYLSYVWEDEKNFNIKQHFPMYRGVFETKADLEKLFSEFASEKIHNTISPWMFRVVPKHDKTGYVLFVKFHHAIGDGFAMMGILSELVDEKPQFINIPTKKSGFLENPLKRMFSGILTGPLALLALSVSINSRNPFQAKSTPEKKTVSWTSPISLSLVKRIKYKTDTTVNDVLMACLAGAIRKYLSDVKTQKPTDLPIAITFNQRSSMEKMKQHIPLGNRSGGVFLNLPIATADAIKRLHIIRSHMTKLKTSPHPHLFSFIYFNIIGGLPEFFGRFSTYSVRNHAALICSNIPGPTKTLYLLKNPIKSIVFTPPLHADMGLSVSIFSYDNSIRLAVMSDEHIISDPTILTNLFSNEVKLLGERILIDD